MMTSQTFRHVLGLVSVVALTLVLLYLSRFWIWTAPWSGDGLFGAKLFSPYGNLVQRWLGGTWFSELSIVVWGCGAIYLLSVLHWLSGKISR